MVIDLGLPYSEISASHTHTYLWKPIVKLIRENLKNTDSPILDCGCGNGAFTAQLLQQGLNAYGIDNSTSGIALAKDHFDAARFAVGSAYAPIPQELSHQTFDLIVSLEVIEHLISPQQFIKNLYDALNPGGILILTTPYHGYLKNLCIAVTNKFDSHFDPLWEGGHIKFWSFKTLSKLLEENHFKVIQHKGAGRVPYLWKSMILVATKD